MFSGSLAPLRLISIITYSGSGIQRRRYPEVAIKGVNKKARGTRWGKRTHESPSARAVPPWFCLLPRNSGPVQEAVRWVLKPMIYIALCVALKSKGERKNQREKKNPALKAFSAVAFFAWRSGFFYFRALRTTGRQEVLGDNM